MKQLEAKLSRDGSVVQGSAINFGKWDIDVGLHKSFYLRNPNSYAKANMKGIKHKDARIKIDIPDEIMPLETVPIDINVPPMKFKTEAEEEAFFSNVMDSIFGTIQWETP